MLPDLKLEPAMAFFGFWLALIASQTCFGVGPPAKQNGELPADAEPEDAMVTSATAVKPASIVD